MNGDIMIETLMNKARTEERQRCVNLIRQYLLFNSQRAVSWHEVMDVIEAINRGDEATGEWNRG